MTKKRCKVKLWIIVLFCIIGLFLTFASFVIPTTNTTFNGFFNAINYGYDLDGGYLAVYKVANNNLTDEEIDVKLNSTVSRLNSSLSSLGLSVSKQDKQLRVEISNTDYIKVQNLYTKYGVDIFGLIGSEKGITFSSSSSNYQETGFVGGDYISECHYEYINTSWCVVINFTEEGKTKFKALTKDIIGDSSSGTLYMFIDGEAYGSGFTIDNPISSLTLVSSTQKGAEALALEISALSKNIVLTQYSNNIINGGLNTSTQSFFGNEKILLVSAFCIIILASFVLLCIKYRILGALAVLANLIFITVYSFLLQSIPLVYMDFNGVLGVLFTYLILVFGEITIFEKIKKEYAIGKKIPNSVKSGFKKNILSFLEKYVFILIFSSILYIVGSTALQSFAVNLFVGIFVNYFILFAVLRGVCVLYLPINSTKKELYNLKREAVRNEI